MSEEYESDDYIEPAVVIDNGSSFMKCGFGGDDSPRAVFPTTVGRPRHRGVMVGMGRKDAYVGDEAMAKRGILSLINPIDYGYVTNWDDMEKIWHHAFYNELRVAPEEHGVLLSDKIPTQKKINREKIIQIMFETFNVPCFYISLQSQLNLYAAGLQTGISVDLGYNVTYCVPYVDGQFLQSAITSTDVGGNDITNYLQQTLNNNDLINSLKKSIPIRYKYRYMNVIDDIKHKEKLVHTKIFPEWSQNDIEDYMMSGYLRNHTQFNLNANRNLISRDIMSLCYRFYDDKPTISYTLPDKTKIYLNEYEKSQCVECLFKPALLSNVKKSSEVGIQEICYQTIEKCQNIQDIDANDKKKLFENIVLFGGSSMLEGIDHRLEREISKLKVGNEKINVKINCQKYAAWYGGSVLTSLSTFNDMWITKDRYDEIGPTSVHQCV